MSIINDALKKVQDSLSSQPEKKIIPAETAITGTNGAQEFQAMAPIPTPSAAPAASSSTPAAAIKTVTVKTKETNMVYILGSLCLLIALFAPIVNHQSVFGLITHSKKSVRTIQPPAAPRTPSAATPTSTVAQKAASIKEELTKSIVSFSNAATSSSRSSGTGRHIALSGIVAQGGKNVALIEGQIYEAGETVDNVKIIQINSANVVIEENGQQRTIKVGQ